jgi:hypothetical protein
MSFPRKRESSVVMPEAMQKVWSIRDGMQPPDALFLSRAPAPARLEIK